MQYGQQKLAQGGSIMLAPQKHIQCKILRPEPLMNSKINPHLGPILTDIVGHFRFTAVIRMCLLCILDFATPSHLPRLR